MTSLHGRVKRPLANALFIQNINPLKQKKPELNADQSDLIVGGGEEVKLGAEVSPRMSLITVNDKSPAEAQEEQFKIQLAKGGAVASQKDESGGSRPNSSASRSR